MELYRFAGKNVRITLMSGETLIGKVALYTSELDNEPDPASISLETGTLGALTEISESEIKTIEATE